MPRERQKSRRCRPARSRTGSTRRERVYDHWPKRPLCGRALSSPRSCGGAAVNSDAVPKDLDRMIDAAPDRGAEVLWGDAGHRAPMQVAADRVEKLHGCELRIVEADEAARAPVRQHAGKLRVGVIGSELVESPREFGKADALGD